MKSLSRTTQPFFFAATCVTLLTQGTGCLFGGDDDEEADFAAMKPQDPQTFSADFQSKPYGAAACDAHDGKLRGKRELRVFKTSDFDATVFTRGLASYYARHDLTFYTQYPSFDLKMPYVIDTDERRLESSLRRKFPKVNFDADEFEGTDAELAQIQAAAAEFVMKPLLNFVEKYGHQDPAVTNVILTGKVASTDALEDNDAVLAGLSISPELLKTLRATGDESAAIWQGVPLPATFNAMVFVDAKFLQSLRRPTVVDLVIAHEFGHSAGLVHVEDESNLMTPTTGPNNATCDQSLTDAQLATMAKTLRVGDARVVQALQASSETKPVAVRKTMPTQNRWQKVRSQLIGAHARPAEFLRDLLHPHEGD